MSGPEPDEPEDTPAQALPVFLLDDDEDDDDDDPPQVATVLLAPDGTLELEQADPAHEALLHEALARINAKAELALRSTTPLAADDAVGATTFTRGTPGFPNAVRAYLERFYGLRLG